jgi:hypothetical protein
MTKMAIIKVKPRGNKEFMAKITLTTIIINAPSAEMRDKKSLFNGGMPDAENYDCFHLYY